MTMDPRFSKRWLFAPLGAVTAGALVLSGGLSSAQTPDPGETRTPGATATPVTTGTPGANQTPADPMAPSAADLPHYDEILAEELDISLDELRDARERAQERYIDELVEADVITEEQAEQLKDWNPVEKIRDALERVNVVALRDFLVVQIAGVYDMDRQELERELSEGKTLKEIAEEQDVDTNEIRTNFQEQADGMLDMAVQSNALTQEQADAISDAIDNVMDAIFDDDSGALPDVNTPDVNGTETPTVPAP
jgi:hypothetical protein